MKIAVTGANGFVGNNLSNYLTQKGIQISRVQRKKRLNTIFIPNCNRATDWSEALTDVETVIHCASIVHNKRVDNFESFYKVNVQGTESLVSQAAKAGVKNIIFISTIKVNGENSSLLNPFGDNSEVNPHDYYSISKLFAENSIKFISKIEGINYVIIRPGLIYGPGVRANFYNLIKLVDSGLPLPFKGVKNMRSLLFIDNLGEFIYQLIKKSYFKNQIFVLSDSTPLSLSELINLIYLQLDKKSRNFYFPLKILKFILNISGKKDLSSRLLGSLVIDSSSAREDLCFETPFSTDYGVKKTVQWYLKHK